MVAARILENVKYVAVGVYEHFTDLLVSIGPSGELSQLMLLNVIVDSHAHCTVCFKALIPDFLAAPSSDYLDLCTNQCQAALLFFKLPVCLPVERRQAQ